MEGHTLDLAIIAVIVLSILTGLFRGFAKELLALCIWVLAGWLAYSYSDMLSPSLASYISDNTIRTGAAFLIILFSTLIIGGIINTILSSILKKTGLNGTDRTLGGVFGFVRGIFIVALIMIGVKLTSLPYQHYAKQSLLYAQFDPVVDWMQGYMPTFIQKVKSVDVNNNLGDAETTLTLVDN